MEISAVVMAAGKSTRMKSKHSKVVFQVSGKPIIQWVADALFESGCQDQVYIVGEQQAEIRSVLGENVAYVLQEEQRGTGHAVMQAAPFLEGRDGLTIVLPVSTRTAHPKSLRSKRSTLPCMYSRLLCSFPL